MEGILVIHLNDNFPFSAHAIFVQTQLSLIPPRLLLTCEADEASTLILGMIVRVPPILRTTFLIAS